MDSRLFNSTNHLDVAQIPKVELHVHFEATMSRKLIRELNTRHQLNIPEKLFTGDGKNIGWADFMAFLNQYDEASRVACTKDAITLMAYDYLCRSHTQGVIYTELTVSPQHIAIFGKSFQGQSLESVYNDVMSAVQLGIDQAYADVGISARILMVVVRHFDIKNSEDLVDIMIRNKEQHPYVVGIGLAGAENGFPPSLFKNLFAKARAHGFGCTAHASEVSHPLDAENAVKELGVTRIGHGILAAFNPDSLKWLKDNNIHFELALTSNHLLETKKNYPKEHENLEHPVTLLENAGMSFSFSTDDPCHFGDVCMVKEYQLGMKLLKCGADRMIGATLDGIDASFAPDSLKQELREKAMNFAKVEKLQVVRSASTEGFNRKIK